MRNFLLIFCRMEINNMAPLRNIYFSIWFQHWQLKNYRMQECEIS
jgi:hypothetical protein